MTLTCFHSVLCCSVAQSCLTLCDPMDCSMPGFPVLHHLLDRAQTHVHWVSDAIHLILCCRLLLPPSIFPSIRVFSNESVLRIRWPKDWSFSLSISEWLFKMCCCAQLIFHSAVFLLMCVCSLHVPCPYPSLCVFRNHWEPWRQRKPRVLERSKRSSSL